MSRHGGSTTHMSLIAHGGWRSPEVRYCRPARFWAARFSRNPAMLFQVKSATPDAPLNQSQGGMCICGRRESGWESRWSASALIAAPSHLILPVGQPGQEVPGSFLYCLSGPQAQVASGLFSRPAPDGLISVEVWAVASVHEPQVQVRRPQVFPQRLATMGPGHCPRSRSAARCVSPATAPGRQPGPGVAVALKSHPLHLPRLQAHRWVVAGLLPVLGTGRVHQCRFSSEHPLVPQLRVGPEVGLAGKEYLGSGQSGLLPKGGILRNEGLPLRLIGLEQALLGARAPESSAGAHPWHSSPTVPETVLSPSRSSPTPSTPGTS